MDYDLKEADIIASAHNGELVLLQTKDDHFIVANPYDVSVHDSFDDALAEYEEWKADDESDG